MIEPTAEVTAKGMLSQYVGVFGWGLGKLGVDDGAAEKNEGDLNGIHSKGSVNLRSTGVVERVVVGHSAIDASAD